MNMGTMTWACLLLAGQTFAAPEAWHINQSRFKIPVVVFSDRRADVQRVQLWVSHDEGKSWNKEMTIPASTKEFLYEAAHGDGVYWFVVTTLDSRGTQEPVDVFRVPPEKIQRIIVDTSKPDVHITSATRRGQDVLVGWHVQDKWPDPASLRVEFRTTTMAEGQWLPVNVAPGAQQTTFRPGPGDLLVRVLMRDRAGNLGEDRAGVDAGTGAAPSGSDATASKVEPASGVTPRDAVPPSPRGSGPAGPSIDTSFPPALPSLGATSTSLSPRDTGKPAGSGNTSGGAAPLPAFDSSPRAASPSTLPGRDLDPTPASPLPSDLGKSAAAVEPSPLASMTKGSLQRLKIVRKNRVKIDFDVAKLGPSGIGGVEVYVTQDEGATWAPTTYDSLALPQATDMAAPGGVRGSVMVTLPKEGTVFGFYLIVKSRAGLGKPPPRPGDPPHLRLELDATGPLAALYKPEADHDHPNALVLRWKAWDRNPAERSVTLEYAEGREGPWNRIADELPNKAEPGPIANGPQLEALPTFTGTHVWQLPTGIPPKVYLKMTVKDAVGNVTVAQTPEPILIDLVTPEVGNVSTGN
jgi:hypothetical protein